MREVIYRGKPVERFKNFLWVRKDLFDELGFVHGSLFADESGRTYICVEARCTHTTCIDNGSATMIEVLPETVGQYTGLKDKNGKRIFEGDIIRYADEYEYRMYLESLECPEDYQDNAFDNMWTIDEVVYGINVGYPAFDLNKHDWEVNGLSNLVESRAFYYEVIGNIHSNPELLE